MHVERRNELKEARMTIGKLKDRQYIIVVMILAAILSVFPGPSNARDVDWTIAPYLWASDVGLDVFVDSDPAIGIDVPFKDLVDKLDSAFMGHVELRADKLGGFFDIVAIKLADSAVIPVGPGGPILGDLLIDTNLKLNLFELGGFYRLGSAASGSGAFDLLLGGRKIDADQSFNITLPGPGAMPLDAEIDISETDVFIGGRFVGRFNEKWGYRVRADYGGGGTEGTLNAIASIAYSFGKTGLFSLELGYRYLNIELEDNSDGSVTETEVTMSGPALGFIFNF